MDNNEIQTANDNRFVRHVDSTSEKKNRKNILTPPAVGFLDLFSFEDSMDRVLMCLGSLGGVAAGLPLPLLTYVFGDLFDVFGNSVPSHELLHKVTVASLKCVVVAGLTSVGFFIDAVCWRVTAERQTARMRHRYICSLLNQDVSFLDTQISTGEIIETISADILCIREVIGQKVGKVIQLGATFLCGFVIAFIRGWRLTLVVLATVPIIGAAGAVGPLLTAKVSKKLNVSNTEVGNIVSQAITSIRTVASFGGEKKAVDSSKRALSKLYRVSLRLGFTAGFGQGLLIFATFSVYAFTLWYGAWIVVHNGYSGGQVTTVLFAVLAGGGALGQSFPCFSAFTAAKLAKAKLFMVINSVPQMDRSKDRGVVPISMNGHIQLQNVSFWYPSRPDVKILENYSLDIKPGETVALVGESGSGKSTVISLIERFYDPQIGNIVIDGVDVKDIQIQWLREQIGLVSQEPVLFGVSIKDNIGFGKPMATSEEIQKAAALANVNEFVKSLQEGYETMVGDRGAQLSLGQKQRIAIARAILKNPRILLLDEATSALDSASERLVQEALERVMVDRTTVEIAHRLSTIKNAHSICVMKGGSLIAKGTHIELMQRRDSAYSQMVKRQESQHEEEAEKSESDGENVKGISRDGSNIGRSSRHSSFRSTGSVAPSERETFQNIEALKKNLRKDIQSSIFRLAPLYKPEVHVLVLGCLAAVANGTLLPIFGLLLADVIDSFYEPFSQLKKDSIFWSGMFLVLAFAALLVIPGQISCFTLTGNKLVQRLRTMTFRNAIRQEMGWFDEHETSSGVISSRISTDSASIKSVVGDGASLMLQNLATIVCGLCIAFLSNWQLAFMLIGLLALLILQSWTQLKLVKTFSAKSQIAWAKPVHVAIDALSNIRTVASFCAEDHVLQMHAKKCEDPLRCAIQLGTINGLGFAFTNFVLYSTYAFGFWVGAQLIIHGQTTHRKIFRVFFALILSAIGISESVQMVPDISRVQSAVSSLFSIIDRKSKIDPEDISGNTLDEMQGEITFRGVYFNYPTRPTMPILLKFNLHLDPGKSIALVGESGSGKSTVLSLLERFYDPDRGDILLDKTNIKSLQVRWLRRQMGLVGQEPFLFDQTIRENIAYGRQAEDEEDFGEEEIISAAKIANAHNFISGLPDGYQTRVGERGIQLSGGQKQRISIARAIVRNPRILLLDEATSALDVESEHLVQEALNRAMKGKSTIVVAHRLSTVRGADSIAVMRRGRVVESGKHQELVFKTNGAYTALVNSSFSREF